MQQAAVSTGFSTTLMQTRVARLVTCPFEQLAACCGSWHIKYFLALQVSFAELVAVFLLEELRSPVLRNWVEAQQAVSTAVQDTSVELSEEEAALKIQSGFRGGTAR